ncbi:hypothetical protein GCM10027280_55250 [Micromonospora polyrhachis]
MVDLPDDPPHLLPGALQRGRRAVERGTRFVPKRAEHPAQLSPGHRRTCFIGHLITPASILLTSAGCLLQHVVTAGWGLAKGQLIDHLAVLLGQYKAGVVNGISVVANTIFADVRGH